MKQTKIDHILAMRSLKRRAAALRQVKADHVQEVESIVHAPSPDSALAEELVKVKESYKTLTEKAQTFFERGDDSALEVSLILARVTKLLQLSVEEMEEYSNGVGR